MNKQMYKWVNPWDGEECLGDAGAFRVAIKCAQLADKDAGNIDSPEISQALLNTMALVEPEVQSA